MSDRDLIALTTGGLLLASGLKRAEDAAVRAVRADVLRRVDATGHLWRRRANNAVATLTLAVGGLVLLHQYRQRGNGRYQRTDEGPVVNAGPLAHGSSDRGDAA